MRLIRWLRNEPFLATMFTVIGAFAAIIVYGAATGELGRSAYSEQAADRIRDICEFHDGVRSVNDDDEIVICRDGHVDNYD